jgi:outer membrane protein assembly factor BamD
MKSAPWQVWGARSMVVPALFLLAACGATVDNVQSPARLLYLEGQHLEDQGLFTEAAEKFEKLVSQHPGTRLGGHGYLRLAELYSRQQEWIKAETNYRMFLAANSGSPLSSYVLYRLLRVNHEQSYTGLFFPEREIDRDMEPNRKIMLEYRRFYLLHPQSLYLPEAVTIFRAAEDTLARHEVIVADFYFRRRLYNAAASRYLYALRNHADHVDVRYALGRLVTAYRADQQLDLADEMQRVYDQRFGAATPSAPGGSPVAP